MPKKKQAPKPPQQEQERKRGESARLFDLANDNFRNGRYEAAAAGYKLANDFTPNELAARNAAAAQQRANEARQQAEAMRRRNESARLWDAGQEALGSGRYESAAANFGLANEFTPDPRAQQKALEARREMEAAQRLGLGPPESPQPIAIEPSLPDPETLRQMMAALQRRGQ